MQHHHMKKLATRVIDKLADRIARQVGESMSNSDAFADRIAYRVALETILGDSIGDRKPNEVFSSISDGFWFWLCTEGYERKRTLRKMLPAMPDENVQLTFTGAKGNSLMKEGFNAYRLFRDSTNNMSAPLVMLTPFWILAAAGEESYGSSLKTSHHPRFGALIQRRT